MKTDEVIKYLIPVGLLLTAIWVISSILKKTGIIADTEKEKELVRIEKTSALTATEVFYKEPKPDDVQLLSATDAEPLIEQFDNSFGFFNDNEEMLYQLFASMPSKKYINVFAKRYQDATKENIDQILLARLSADERTKILLLISAKPNE